MRIKALDGLRAVAVLLVILSHWPSAPRLEFGWIGVNIFFVLSGFLICSILLKEKSKPPVEYFRTFYLKRCLRIFPIYFLYLFACMLIFSIWHPQSAPFDAAYNTLNKHQISLLTYTFNFLHISSFAPGFKWEGSKFFNHLWSLCIEEQFYLIFPVIVLLMNRKMLKIILLTIVIASPLIRAFGGEILRAAGVNPIQVGIIMYKIPFFQADSLGLGCLIAVIGVENIRATNRRILLTILALSLFNLSTVWLLRACGESVPWRTLGFDLAAKQTQYQTGTLLDYKYAWSFSILNLICGGFLLLCLRENWISKIFSNRGLMWIGKVSYGIYLFHNPLIEIYRSLFGASLLLFPGYMATVLIISGLSFRYIESPFLRLKDKLESSRKTFPVATRKHPASNNSLSPSRSANQ